MQNLDNPQEIGRVGKMSKLKCILVVVHSQTIDYIN